MQLLIQQNDHIIVFCEQGHRTTHYKGSVLEIFAKFGDCSRWDGLTERLTKYADPARTVVLEVREWYQRRKDKLRERHQFPKEESVMVRGVYGPPCVARCVATCSACAVGTPLGHVI